MPHKLQQANAVCNGFGLRRDFDRIALAVARNLDVSRQARRSLKIVNEKQDVSRYGIGSKETVRQLLESFHLDVAPLAACFASLREPVKLASNVSREFPTALSTAAGREECAILRLALF